MNVAGKRTPRIGSKWLLGALTAFLAIILVLAPHGSTAYAEPPPGKIVPSSGWSNLHQMKWYGYEYVTEIEGKEVSIGKFTYRIDGKTVYLGDIEVNKEFQRRGVQTALYTEAMKAEHFRDATTIRTTWNGTNAIEFKNALDAGAKTSLEAGHATPSAKTFTKLGWELAEVDYEVNDHLRAVYTRTPRAVTPPAAVAEAAVEKAVERARPGAAVLGLGGGSAAKEAIVGARSVQALQALHAASMVSAARQETILYFIVVPAMLVPTVVAEAQAKAHATGHLDQARVIQQQKENEHVMSGKPGPPPKPTTPVRDPVDYAVREEPISDQANQRIILALSQHKTDQAIAAASAALPGKSREEVLQWLRAHYGAYMDLPAPRR